MMLHRCTACTHDHGKLPAACERCGGMSFAAIPLTGLEVVEKSPGFPDDLEGELQAAFAAEPRLRDHKQEILAHVARARAEGQAPPLVASLVAAAALDDETQKPPAVDDDAPPTPRDMPAGPHVLEGPEGEKPEVRALRPVERKATNLCSQADCELTATHRFTWPGHPESRACYAHGLKAMQLAEAMGFFLEVSAL